MRNIFLFLSTVLFVGFAHGQIYLEKQDTPVYNLPVNPGFESGKGQWVIAVSSTASIVNGSNALQGNSSLRFDSTAASQTVRTLSLTVPKSLQGKRCQLEALYYNNEPTNFYLLRALNASGTVIASTPLSTVASATVARLYDFTCPTTTMTAEVISTAAALPVDLDAFHFGSVKNLTKTELLEVLGYEPVATVSATSPLQITGGASNPVISLPPTGVASGGPYTKFYADEFGRITSATVLIESDIPSLQTTKITSGVFPIERGGTNNGATGVASGGIYYGDGTKIVQNTPGVSGQVLISQGSAAPIFTSMFSNQTIASQTINWDQATTFTRTLSANTVVSFAGAQAGQTISVIFTNTASNYTVSWPTSATLKWAGGTAPTMSPGATTDVYTFIYNGVFYYGSYVQDMR